MRFMTTVGEVEYNRSDGLTGDPDLVERILEYVEIGRPAGCNFWGEIAPSFESLWTAYLSICGALTEITGQEPYVDEIPDNPAGYDEEGPTPPA